LRSGGLGQGAGDKRPWSVGSARQPTLQRPASLVGEGRVFPTGLLPGQGRASNSTPAETDTDEGHRRKETRAMTKHKTGTRKEWLAARLELLEAEKELTRRSDELARRRQELPWVRIDKEYRFETDEGSAPLAGLFRGRSQLLVY